MYKINLKLEIPTQLVCLHDAFHTTLHHILIKVKRIDIIEITFQREGSPYLACSDRNAYFTFGKA